MGYVTIDSLPLRPSGSNNGGTEAINGIIELHRRITRGDRDPDKSRRRMLLLTDRLAPLGDV